MNIRYVAVMEDIEMHTIRFKKNATFKQLLPIIKRPKILHCTCARCNYVNAIDNNFCTNCGYPVKEKENAALFHIRFKQRKELLRKGEKAIQAARITLYILSLLLFTGIGFFFSELENRLILGITSVVFAFLFFMLAQWSFTKPFTSLITAFILVLTSSTISVFGEFMDAFTSVVGVYSILMSMVLIYFLLKGVQGAYKADLIKEEMEIV
jgi:ribosomal protein L37E